MGIIVQNTESEKYLVEKKGPINLTVKSKENATIFKNEIDAKKEASNFNPYRLIKL
ncbi:hypothetical protein [Carnobacterium sp. FSL E2-0243]|uniref:hypothetical protein n=1 Tax=Carnobacterium sp. FSL E2-0243 TaxID=2921365 RepID=UPI0030F5AB10